MNTLSRHPASAPSLQTGPPVDAYVASAELVDNLQKVLVDLIALHVTAKQAHWTVIGPGFRSLHLALDQVVNDARDHTDEVAERLRALRAVPDGRLQTAADNTALPSFPAGELQVARVVELVTDLLVRTVATIRQVHDEVDVEDPTSADLLHVIIQNLEKHAWMISAESPLGTIAAP